MASLPSVLPARPAVQDDTTTLDQIHASVGKITSPEITPIYICTVHKCFRLFPNQRNLTAHSKKDHGLDAVDEKNVVTWNTLAPSNTTMNTQS
ncbi:hypothetical protein CPB83DRAFT_855599 [Crepidotus variabilis]|uniref:C2H2-type domain-containing protein n=1 Tax=Crepidotus variabilis TaxID=179855 RepID=A0A9P6EE26_9AGAR|nr:hypothetical protein CPB83DRAFT_855599 [Crepidotus variabilis]